jgi:hypothetical protein
MNNHLYDDIPDEATFRMVRDLSGVMNQEVGDGTTSVVIIAAAIYKAMMAYLDKNKDITPYGVKNIFDIILKEVSSLLDAKYIYDIKALPYEEKVKIYEKIATIAANNNSQIGNNVATAYIKSKSDYTYIDIQESMNEKDIMDVNIGFEITSGYIDRHMVTAADGITAEYTNPLYLIIDGPLIAEDLPPLQQWIAWSLEINQPIVIIAAEYHKEIFDFFVKCRTTGFNMPTKNGIVRVQVPLLAIILDTKTEYGMSRLQDLECALGAKALTTQNGKLMEPPNTIQDFHLIVGRSESVLSKPHYIRIRGGGGSREVRDARIKEIEQMIATSIDSAQHGILEAGRIEMLRRRAGMLQGEMHIIRVGGDSYKEKKNRSLIYEDAVMAVKSAVKHGITLGGNVSIYHAIQKNKAGICHRILKELKTGTHNIMINGNDNKLTKIIFDILDIIAEHSLEAFKAVFDNASHNTKYKKQIFNEIKNAYPVRTYNLIKNEFEWFPQDKFNEHIPDLISPGNMDKEILRSCFSILGLFLTSNQLITVHTKRDNKL